MSAARLLALCLAAGFLAGCLTAPGETPLTLDTAKVLAALQAGAAVSEGAFLKAAEDYTKQCASDPKAASCASWAKACRYFKLANAVKPTPEVQAVECVPAAK